MKKSKSTLRERRQEHGAHCVEIARRLLGSGLNAGNRYPEVWIRDLSNFLPLACRWGEQKAVREALLMFFEFQESDGGVIDGYTRQTESVDPYDFMVNPDYPDLVAHKNTVETDQESCLVVAVRDYVRATGDVDFVSHVVKGRTVLQRLEDALGWVMVHRWSAEHGLVWNGTTVDWGDCQPEHEWGVVLDENSHPALCIYTNAQFLLAVGALVDLLDRTGRPSAHWIGVRNDVHAAVRRHLWDAKRSKFIPHIYLEAGSPFPEDYDEAAIFFHGGTGVAMQAGLLTRDEALACYEIMRRNVAEAGARSIGITLWPLYNVPDAVNKNYRIPFEYQNGGDWPWWGGRIVLGLIACGLHEQAREALDEITDIVVESGGFYEWHHRDGTPHGSSTFRAAAGTVSLAILQLAGDDSGCSPAGNIVR